MTVQIKHRCPHCRELCDFVLSQPTECLYRNVPAGIQPLWSVEFKGSNETKRSKLTNAHEFCVLSRCSHCFFPVMFVILTGDGQLFVESQKQQFYSGVTHRFHPQFVIISVYPNSAPAMAHESWPENIKRPFVEARQMLDEKKSPFFIISACRSVLDVVTKDISKNDGDKRLADSNLFDRIGELRKRGIITEAISSWADEIRKFGNEQIHELSGGNEDDARQFIEFIALLLHVAYELPAMIASRKIVQSA